MSGVFLPFKLGLAAIVIVVVLVAAHFGSTDWQRNGAQVVNGDLCQTALSPKNETIAVCFSLAPTCWGLASDMQTWVPLEYTSSLCFGARKTLGYV